MWEKIQFFLEENQIVLGNYKQLVVTFYAIASDFVFRFKMFIVLILMVDQVKWTFNKT